MLKTLLKWLSIILCFTVIFTLTSCNDEIDDNKQDNNTQEEQPNNNQDQNNEPDGNNEQDQTHIGELPWI